MLYTEYKQPTECTRCSSIDDLHLPCICGWYLHWVHHRLCRRTLSDLGGIARGGLWWGAVLYPPHVSSSVRWSPDGLGVRKTKPLPTRNGCRKPGLGAPCIWSSHFRVGLAVEAASFLVFGLYMLTAAVIQVVVKRKLPIVVASLSFGVAMSIIGIIGLNAAG